MYATRNQSGDTFVGGFIVHAVRSPSDAESKYVKLAVTTWTQVELKNFIVEGDMLAADWRYAQENSALNVRGVSKSGWHQLMK